MSLVRFLLMVAIGTLLSWTAWVMVLTTLDPFTNPMVGPLLFYFSAWLAVTGTMMLLGFFVRHWLERQGVPFQQVAVSLRQAVLLSSGLVVILVFQHAQLLNLWTFLLLVVLVIGTEVFFLAGQTRRPSSNQPVTT